MLSTFQQHVDDRPKVTKLWGHGKLMQCQSSVIPCMYGIPVDYLEKNGIFIFIVFLNYLGQEECIAWKKKKNAWKYVVSPHENSFQDF